MGIPPAPGLSQGMYRSLTGGPLVGDGECSWCRLEWRVVPHRMHTASEAWHCDAGRSDLLLFTHQSNLFSLDDFILVIVRLQTRVLHVQWMVHLNIMSRMSASSPAPPLVVRAKDLTAHSPDTLSHVDAGFIFVFCLWCYTFQIARCSQKSSDDENHTILIWRACFCVLLWSFISALRWSYNCTLDISWLNITWYWTQYKRKKLKLCSDWIPTKTSIPCPYGQAMGCLLEKKIFEGTIPRDIESALYTDCLLSVVMFLIVYKAQVTA